MRFALVAVLLILLLGCAHADRAQLAAAWNIGVMAGSGPAAIPVALWLALWQWDSWTVDVLDTSMFNQHFHHSFVLLGL